MPRSACGILRYFLSFISKQNGISGTLQSFSESYLYNRKQRVMINDSFSDYANIESGVLQDSVSCPLLFVVYINDLEKIYKVKCDIADERSCNYSDGSISRPGYN